MMTYIGRIMRQARADRERRAPGKVRRSVPRYVHRRLSQGSALPLAYLRHAHRAAHQHVRPTTTLDCHVSQSHSHRLIPQNWFGPTLHGNRSTGTHTLTHTQPGKDGNGSASLSAATFFSLHNSWHRRSSRHGEKQQMNWMRRRVSLSPVFTSAAER